MPHFIFTFVLFFIFLEHGRLCSVTYGDEELQIILVEINEKLLLKKNDYVNSNDWNRNKSSLFRTSAVLLYAEWTMNKMEKMSRMEKLNQGKEEFSTIFDRKKSKFMHSNEKDIKTIENNINRNNKPHNKSTYNVITRALSVDSSGSNNINSNINLNDCPISNNITVKPTTQTNYTNKKKMFFFGPKKSPTNYNANNTTNWNPNFNPNLNSNFNANLFQENSPPSTPTSPPLISPRLNIHDIKPFETNSVNNNSVNNFISVSANSPNKMKNENDGGHGSDFSYGEEMKYDDKVKKKRKNKDNNENENDDENHDDYNENDDEISNKNTPRSEKNEKHRRNPNMDGAYIPSLNLSFLNFSTYLPMTANTPKPIKFENDFFVGVLLLLVNTKDVCEQYAKRFEGSLKF